MPQSQSVRQQSLVGRQQSLWVRQQSLLVLQQSLLVPVLSRMQRSLLAWGYLDYRHILRQPIGPPAQPDTSPLYESATPPLRRSDPLGRGQSGPGVRMQLPRVEIGLDLAQ